MNLEQRAIVREQCKTMTMRAVAAGFGITRQRVHQILHERDEGPPRRFYAKRYPPPVENGAQVVLFTSKYKHLANAAVQQEIRTLAAQGLKMPHLAKRFQCNPYAIQKVLHCTMPSRAPGRPRKQLVASVLDTSSAPRAITTA